MEKQILSIDIETFSSVSLRDSGVYAYAESPDFEVLIFAYAFDDGPVEVIDHTRDDIPADVFAALLNPDVVKSAFNAQFERVCLAQVFGETLAPEQWQCTSVLARQLGLPANLEDVGAVVGLLEDQQKLKTGRALMRYFSFPCKPTKANRQRTRNLPEHAPDKWSSYMEYCGQDVTAERAIRQKLTNFKVVESEQGLWVLDQKINDRGVKVDLAIAENAIEMDEIVKTRLLEEAQELTGLENPNSNKQVKDWIESVSGVTIESLNKKEIASVRAFVNHEDVSAMLDIRTGLSKTSTGKYSAMVRSACEDSRIRGTHQFYGASRTGRWAGRLLQLQNLPRISMKGKDLDLARQLVKAGDLEILEMLYSSTSSVLSQLIRTAVIPEPGNRLVVVDFSAIEARVLAWLAGEKWKMDVFDTHGKIYEATAERMFNLPAGSVTKDSPERHKGKQSELACGYGGSVGALKNMGALESGLTEKELMPLVKAWRAANKNIVQFWYDCNGAALETVEQGLTVNLQHDIRFRKQGLLMRLRLPSGRELSYLKPRVADGSLSYEGTLGTSGAWGRVDTFGGKLVENITQAVARDCLASALTRVDELGYKTIFHVHDEIVCEVPEALADKALADIEAVMGEELLWAEGLNLKGDGFHTDYYKKD